MGRNRHWRNACSVFAGLSFLLVRALGATYYVSPDGSDANSGSQSHPWKTIQKAADTMVAGDIAIVEAGYYPEKPKTTTDGTAGNPVSFYAQDGVTNDGWLVRNSYNVISNFNCTLDSFPVYDGGKTGNYVGYVTEITGNHNWLINCQIGNVGSDQGVVITNSSSRDGSWNFYNLVENGIGNVVSNCNLFNINVTAVQLGGMSNLITGSLLDNTFGHDCFHVTGVNNIIRGCVATNIVMNNGNIHSDFVQMSGSYGSDTRNIVIEDCVVWPGIYQVCNLDQANGHDLGFITFRNNVFFGAILHATIGTHDTCFLNNLFVNCGFNLGTELWFEDGWGGGDCSNCVVMNNIFIQCGEAYNRQNTIPYWGSTNNFRADYNYVSGFNWTPLNTNTKVDPNNVFREPHGVNGGNPRFVDFIYTTTNYLDQSGKTPVMISTNYTADFHLTSGSFLIGAGTNLSALFSKDADGNLRPTTGPWSIGPYQYQLQSSNSTSVAPPTGLVAMPPAGTQ